MKLSVEHAGVGRATIEKHAKKLAPYVKQLREVVARHEWGASEASLNLPTDHATRVAVEAVRKKFVFPDLRWVVVVGIGGSSLGTEAIYEAIMGRFDRVTGRYPKLLCLDTCDPTSIETATELLSSLAPSQFVCVFVSKSGTTTETLVNIQALCDAWGKKVPRDRFVVISGDGSPLTAWAKENRVSWLPIPEKVGGRFSALSAVGLLPLSLLVPGAWHELLDGARTMVDRCVATHQAEKNPAVTSAAVLFAHTEAGMAFSDLFLFEPSLRALGLWYRQLFGESIGKTTKALIPTVSVGSTDLHSVGQWYLGGPNNGVTTFVSVKKSGEESPLRDGPFSAVVPGLSGKKPSEVMHAILSGTMRAYSERKRPFMHVEFDSVSMREVGAFMQFKMIEEMLLARLMKINAFDQPAVESYKEHTRQLLKIIH